MPAWKEIPAAQVTEVSHEEVIMWKSKLNGFRSAYSRLTRKRKIQYGIAAVLLVAGCTLGTFTAWPEQETIGRVR